MDSSHHQEVVEGNHRNSFVLRSNIFFGIFAQTTVCACTGEVSDTEVCAEMIMQLPLYRTRLKAWLLGRLRTLRPRRNRLQFKETLELKSKGLTSSGVSVLAGRTRFLSHV